ncbi:MAG: family 43 glycosylhydrolase [Muribaculaceae bacterium]|nr:family 43 glycosylhydrolase [Muribaculaceae bacterium]
MHFIHNLSINPVLKTIFFSSFLSFIALTASAVSSDSIPIQDIKKSVIQNPNVHDPVMAFEDGRFYLFSTGNGISMMSSSDLSSWNPEKAPLDPIPEWAKDSVPGYNGHTWAPDIFRSEDRWLLYYSCSSFGKNSSAIGVLSNTTLNPKSPDYKWEDLGLVIQSIPGKTDWNAIDPNIITDKDGNPWLTFGSFWDGIQLVRLMPDMKTPLGQTVTIARRHETPSDSHTNGSAGQNAIEAPFITYRDGYYYLFVSHDYCCRGAKSDYKTVVGRSKNVDGPYLDRDGRDMTTGGGSFVAGQSDDYYGVGHCSVYEFNGKWCFIAHGYAKRDSGASKLFIREIKWKDGWPEIQP